MSRYRGEEPTEHQPNLSAGGTEPRVRAAYGVLTAATALVVIVGSLQPFEPRAVTIRQAGAFLRQALTAGMDFSRVDWVSNCLLFIPLSFCATAAIAGTWVSTTAGVAARMALVMAAGLVVSISVEMAQIWAAGRIPSPHDVAAQTIGGCLGIAAWLVLGGRVTERLDHLLSDASREGLVTAAYGLGLVLYWLWPFSLTVHPVDLLRTLRDGGVKWVPFSDEVRLHDLLGGTVLVPFGVLLGRLAAARGDRPAAWSRVAVGGVLFAAGLELSQIFVQSSVASATDAIVAAGGVLGGLVGHRIFSRYAAGE